MTQPIWTLLDPRVTMAHLGFLPGFLDADSPDAASSQLDKGYKKYGGWRPQQDFEMTDNNYLTYPGDPPLRPIAETSIRGETIRLYEHAFVAVIQADGSFEVCRMD